MSLTSDKVMVQMTHCNEDETNIEPPLVDSNEQQHLQDDGPHGRMESSEQIPSHVDVHLETPGSHWNEDVVGNVISHILIPIKDIVTSPMDGTNTRVSDFTGEMVGNTTTDRDDNVNDDRDPTTTTTEGAPTSPSISRRQDDRTQRRAGRIRNRQQMGNGRFQSEASNGNTSAIVENDVHRIKKIDPTGEGTSQPSGDMQPDSPTKEGVPSKTGYSIPLNQPLGSQNDYSTARRQRRRAERQNRRTGRGGLLSDSNHSADTMNSRNSSVGSLQSNDDDDGFASSEVAPTQVTQHRQQSQQTSSGVTTIETDTTRCSSPTNILLTELEEPKIESPTKILVSTLEAPRIPSPTSLLMSDLEAPNVPSPTRLSENQIWTSVTRDPSATTSTPQDDQSVPPPPPPLLSSTPRFVAPIRATSLPVPEGYQLHKRNLGGNEPGRSMSAQQPQQGTHRGESQQSPGAYFIPGRAIGFRPAWATRQRNSDGQDNGRQQRRESRTSLWRRRSSAANVADNPNGSRGRRRSSLTDFIRGMQQQNNQTSEEVSPTDTNNDTNNRNDNNEAPSSNDEPLNDSEQAHTTDTHSNFSRLGAARSFRRERSRMVVDAACRLMSMRLGRNRTDNAIGTLGETATTNSGGAGVTDTINNDGEGSPSPVLEKKSNFRLVLLLVAVVFIAITVGVTVGVEFKPSKEIVDESNNGNASVDEGEEDGGGGFNATFSPRESALRSKLAYLTADPKAYENIHSPQYYALKWLANDDSASIQETDKQRLEQRFALAVLYLSVS